ncbi:GWxTD domain-containing protein [Salisaeta longa]|uniref:GWxTD domain-containing protein n=1 Tax=Salisaeta longa TaxID=503170 RepID=UPI0003B4C108|nr:GWxTD domain-containing protein [Salisaeta longa]
MSVLLALLLLGFGPTGDTAPTAARDSLTVAAADAYLQRLTPPLQTQERLQAAATYRRLLGAVKPNAGTRQRAIFQRRVAQLVPLLSDAFKQQILVNPGADAEAWRFRPAAGSTLVRWWRSQDVLPGTAVNERLEEHVMRLVHAQHAYACPEAPAGWDVRGDMYVQYGPPSRTETVTYDSGDFFLDVFRFGVPVSASDFPENVFWAYDHIHEAGYYLFIRRPGDCYRLGTPRELLPPTLRYGRGNSERSYNIAYSSLAAMEYIYRQLALMHIDYGARYDNVANYMDWQEMQAVKARADAAFEARTGQSFGNGSTQSVEVGSGINQTRIISWDPMMGIPPPNQQVTRIVQQGRRAEVQAARRRRAAMPAQYTALLDDVPRLPAAVQTTRFLTPDGRTRLAIDWGVRSADLRGDSARAALLYLRLNQYNRAYRVTHRARQVRPVPATAQRASSDAAVVASLQVPATRAMQHLRVHWAQYDNIAARTLGPRRAQGTVLRDSLAALPPGPGLRMSDLQVMTLPDTAARTLTRATPYPFPTLTPSTPLVLHFEVYGLAQDATGRTRYRVAYTVNERTEGGWRSLWRDDVQTTTTEATYTGTSARSSEYLLLDLATEALKKPRALAITVTVEDTRTQATATRTIRRTLQPE